MAKLPPQKTQARQLEYLTKKKLLTTRICDLRLDLKKSPLTARIQQLYEELANHNFRLKPHFWLSDDWFCPDDIPGVAIPFYLAHKKTH